MSFDLRPAPTASIADLDLDLFQRSYLPSSVAPEIIEDNQRTVEQQLASLRLVTTRTSPTVPTVLGILVIAKDPPAFIPGAYVQFLRLDGQHLSDPIKDSADIGGPLPELIRMLEEKFDAHIEIARDLTSGPIDIPHPTTLLPPSSSLHVTRSFIEPMKARPRRCVCTGFRIVSRS